MDESLYETTYSALACWAEPGARIPDETTILNFRRLLEKHELATGILGATNG
jgi:IS5 family transposase